jgi:pyruvate, water dikinase
MLEDDYSIYTGQKFEKFVNQIKKDASKNIIDNFSGLTASVGKVIGKVRVIMKSSQFNKFKKGEILITSMTTPDFVPAMKKALAVVTDEGGLTCHAAIISRELNVPCIVGTKIATEVLKDGDLVEVNANHGIIRIIK